MGRLTDRIAGCISRIQVALWAGLAPGGGAPPCRPLEVVDVVRCWISDYCGIILLLYYGR